MHIQAMVTIYLPFFIHKAISKYYQNMIGSMIEIITEHCRTKVTEWLRWRFWKTFKYRHSSKHDNGLFRIRHYQRINVIGNKAESHKDSSNFLEEIIEVLCAVRSRYGPTSFPVIAIQTLPSLRLGHILASGLLQCCYKMAPDTKTL